MSIRIVSYGGGVQSTALLVLAAQGRIDFPTFLMANVGDDAEHPATLDYVRNVAWPYAEAHDIKMRVLQRTMKDGSTRDLYRQLVAPDRMSVGIPARMPSGAPGSRACTQDFKVNVIARWLKERGATETDPATVGIGISVDEIQRANGRTTIEWQRITYPLLDLRLRRDDCQRIIREAGLPVPPKSSCYFCPFHTLDAWADMRRREPDLFEKAADLEDRINAKREAAGTYKVWLSAAQIPLRAAVDSDQLAMFEDDGSCDSGWCMT